MSKKVLSIVIVLVVILAGGATAFLATSDFGQELMGRMSRGVSSRDSSPSRDRSAERTTSKSEEEEAALVGSWWCADPPEDPGTDPVEETEGGDTESSTGRTSSSTRFDKFPRIKYLQILTESDKYNWAIPYLQKYKGTFIPGWGFTDPPEIIPGDEEEEPAIEMTVNCMCDGAWDHFPTTDKELAQLGGEAAFCEEKAKEYKCQPKTTLSCVCQDPDEPDVMEVSETVLEETYNGDQQAYCDDLISPIWCKEKYTECEWGFDSEGVHNLCEETYKKMKVAQCAGEEYQPDPGVIEVCEDSSNDMPYLLEAACVTEEACEEYSSLFDSMGCSLNEYLEGIGAGKDVDVTCYSLYGISVPIGGKGCGGGI